MFHVKHFRVVFALHEHNNSSVLPVRVSPKAAIRPVCRLCPNRACASSLRKLLADSPVESSRAGAPADTPSACRRSGFKEHISKKHKDEKPRQLGCSRSAKALRLPNRRRFMDPQARRLLGCFSGSRKIAIPLAPPPR